MISYSGSGFTVLVLVVSISKWPYSSPRLDPSRCGAICEYSSCNGASLVATALLSTGAWLVLTAGGDIRCEVMLYPVSLLGGDNGSGELRLLGSGFSLCDVELYPSCSEGRGCEVGVAGGWMGEEGPDELPLS